MEHTSKPNRIIAFDFLRIIAILFVITIHTTAPTFYAYPIKSGGFLLATLLNSISRPAVPIFVMISGALMLDERKQISNKKIFKKSLYLLLILFGWSIFYASISLIISPPQTGFSISSFIKAILLGHYHLWFLYMLIGLYLFTPILRLFVKKANSKYILYFFLFAFNFLHQL